jgi:hypothetical protein
VLTFLVGSIFAVAMIFASGATANTPVAHAAFTTTNPTADGTGHCKNGNEAVNCNIYDGKQYVWLNGGPAAAQLLPGDYFFAVLDPGGQGGGQNPNDGTDKNLSDPATGDAYTNRTFTVNANGSITYLGTHDFDGTKIRLIPYDDTANPGGVYILAICNLADADPLASNQPGVDPSDCKYDAFKVNSETSIPPATDLSVTKDATGLYDTKYTWQIDKSVNKTKVDLDGSGTATFTYTVTVTPDGGSAVNYGVSGTISVSNPNVDSALNTVPVDIDGISDQLSNGTTCSVTGGGAQTLTQSVTTFPYSCTLSGAPSAPLTNTVTVTWSSQLLDNGAFLAAGSAPFTSDPISFAASGNTIDECINVSDPLDALSPRHFCVGDATLSYTYTRSVSFDPTKLGQCLTYDNTATFTTNDTAATGSDSVTVTVCFFGARLTPGYWKNHLGPLSACTGLRLPTGTSCGSGQPFALTGLPISLGSFSVTNILTAAQIFAAMSCSFSGNAANQNQQAIGCLAGHLLAAKLNRKVNGSDPCIDTTIASADTFLSSIPYTGPGSSYTGISLAQRANAITLKSALDAYNNGGGCHS